MSNVKEKTMVDHFIKNYDLHIDYVLVLKHDLKGQTILPLNQVRIDKENTLEGVVNALKNDIRLLVIENKVLLDEIKLLKDEIKEIKLVQENTIKELITR